MCLEDGDSYEANFSGFSIPSGIPNHYEYRELKFVLSVKSTITIKIMLLVKITTVKTCEISLLGPHFYLLSKLF